MHLPSLLVSVVEHFTMITVIDFTFCRGRQNELVVREVGVSDLTSNRLQSLHFLPPYKMVNIAGESTTSPGTNWSDGYVQYSELERVLQEVTSTAIVVCSFGKEKCNFLENLLDRTVVDVTRGLDCPEPDYTGFQGKTCMLPSHLPPAAECAVRRAHVISQWLKGNYAAILNRPNFSL